MKPNYKPLFGILLIVLGTTIGLVNAFTPLEIAQAEYNDIVEQVNRQGDVMHREARAMSDIIRRRDAKRCELANLKIDEGETITAETEKLCFPHRLKSQSRVSASLSS